jgi:hypothetical protein
LLLAAITPSWANSFGKKAKKISGDVDILPRVAADFRLPGSRNLLRRRPWQKRDTGVAIVLLM